MFTFLQKESNLKPFNTQEAEHVGNVRQVVIIQRVRIQVLAKKKKKGIQVKQDVTMLQENRHVFTFSIPHFGVNYSCSSP